MLPRRFVNLVSRNWGMNDSYSLRRIDAAKHLFYPSAQEAAAAAKDERINRRELYTRARLPNPIRRFDTGVVSPGLEWFELFGGAGKIVHSNTAGETVMFDADMPLVVPTLPGLSQAKGMDPVSLSITHPGNNGGGEDSLYVMHRFPGQSATPSSCFEVLEYRPVVDDMDKRWQWRLLPPPPFIHHQPSCYISSYTTIKGAPDGCTTICVSSSDPDKKNGGGTYCFDTARLEETWRQVGDWAMPFEGRAEHVPELGVWLGFTAGSKPHHLCAVMDLSATMDGPCSEAPMPQHVWEDATVPGEEDWRPQLLRVISMGGNKFCVAKIFHDNKEVGDQFIVLTGVEMERTGHGLRMVRHKRTRHVFKFHSVKWVL